MWVASRMLGTFLIIKVIVKSFYLGAEPQSFLFKNLLKCSCFHCHTDVSFILRIKTHPSNSVESSITSLSLASYKTNKVLCYAHDKEEGVTIFISWHIQAKPGACHLKLLQRRHVSLYRCRLYPPGSPGAMVSLSCQKNGTNH